MTIDPNQLLRWARDLIALFGKDGVVTWCSDALLPMLGYRPDELVGHRVSEVVETLPEDLPHVRAYFAQVAQRTEPSAPHAFRMRHKDGRMRVIEMVVSNQTDNPALEGVVVAARDVTDRWQAQEALKQTQKLESLGVLAGGIAHDFNNLLAVMLGNLSLALVELPAESKVMPLLEDVATAVRRASELTRQMLAYSGRGRLVVRSIELNHIVEEMSGLLAVSVSKKAALTYHLQPDLPTIRADGEQLQQVIMNLVLNASEALETNSPGAGVISISTSLEQLSADHIDTLFPDQPLVAGSYIALEVNDNGAGIAPDTLTRIFDPFFTTKFTGRGLGLSALSGIVRAHRGGIRVHSELGKGSSFKLLFPAESAPVPEVVIAAEPRPAQPPANRGLVLLVDDEEAIRASCTRLLEALGFSCVAARDGAEAVEIFTARKDEIRAVVMDLTMPVLDGRQAFRQLSLIKAEVPVLLTSGYNEQDTVRDFVGKGLAGFLQKPYSLADLREAMARALGN